MPSHIKAHRKKAKKPMKSKTSHKKPKKAGKR